MPAPLLQQRPETARRRSRSSDLEAPITAALVVAAFVLPALAAAPITTEGRAAAAATGWAALALAVAFGVIPRSVPSRRSRQAALALAALAGWTALSLLWTDTAEGTVTEVARIAFIATYPVAIWAGVRPSNWRAAAWAILGVCLAVPVVAVLARVWPDPFSSLSPDLGAGFRRLSFPLGYWNALGAVAAAALVVGLTLGSGLRGPGRRALAAGTIPFAALAIYLSYSRAALALAIAGAVVAVIVARNRRRAALVAATAAAGSAAAILVTRANEDIATGVAATEGWLPLLVVLLAAAASAAAARSPGRSGAAAAQPAARGAVAGLAVAGALAILAAVAIEGPSERVATPPGDAEGGVAAVDDPAVRIVNLDSTRYDLWGSALDAWLAEPLAGIGAGSFSIWWGSEREIGDERVADAHSLPLETLAEMGPIGLIILAAFIGFLIAAALEARRRLNGATDEATWTALALVAATILLGAAFDWLWESGLAVALAVSALALAAVPAMASSRRPRWRGGLRLATFAVAFGCFAIQVPVLVSASSQEDAAAAVVRGDLLGAEAEADRAIDAAPWAAEPYAIRAVVHLQAGDIDAARADALEAIDREPAEPRFQALLQRIEGAG
jgi:hypothetical protein